MIQIKFKKLHENAVIPKKAYESDAGFDVVAVSVEYNTDSGFLEYDLGFSTEIPEGYKGIVVPRSSISKYDLIMCNSPAQIDSSYRGSWKIRFKLVLPSNVNSETQTMNWEWIKQIKKYKVGDKIAQIFIEPVLSVNLLETEELISTQRGEGGFGSTN